MNFPATTWPTTFAGTGEKPGPTMKGWFSTGNEVADEMLAWGNVAADETLSRDDVVAMLAMDSECEGFGGKKVDTKVGTTKAGLPCAAKWKVQQNPLPKQQKRWLAKIAARERPQRPTHWTG